MSENSLFSSIHGYFLEKKQDAQLIEDLNEEVIKIAEDATQNIIDGMDKYAQSILKEHNKSHLSFVKRNIKRWEKHFSQLEQLIIASSEIGNEFSSELSVLGNDIIHKARAVTELHARSILIGHEIMALLKNGFPDGALGRWRTLHEISSVAFFLSIQDDIISERYLQHRNIQNHKGATQYQIHHNLANLEPLDDEEINNIKALYDRTIEKYGAEMHKSDYGWAYPAIGKLKVKFSDIEDCIGLSHWRPRYKWATCNTHANYHPSDLLLASNEVEKKNSLLVAGSSNSGFSDPIQMTAASLRLSCLALLQITPPTIDKLILQNIINTLTDRVIKSFELEP